jgi:23S rRNA (pseudouridine1915-N3)-methyltransferase
MKIHLVTIGKPKLDYAKEGWQEYLSRLSRYHDVHTTHLSDKYAYDAAKILGAVKGSYMVVLQITGQQFTSEQLAEFLVSRELDAREVSFVIGGPEGLPQPVIDSADFRLSFSKLTFPHDLAMVVLLESLYRASTINAGQPYHK